MATALPERNNIAKEHTWDTESVFASDAAMEEALQSVTERLPEVQAFRGRLSDGPDVLADCFELIDEVAIVVGKIGTYATLRFTVDTSDQVAAGINDERVERGEPLTADIMIEQLAALFGEGYGDEVEFDRDEVGIRWAQFPTHLYLNFFVYQYATGISGAHALAKRVLGAGCRRRLLGLS